MKKLSLSRDQLRYFAIFAMTLDHIAWYFVPYLMPLAHVMHFFGRMTAPIMCFFIAEGFKYTSNIKKYALRLSIFAVISQLPFSLLWHRELNMMFTLLFGLLSLIVYESKMKPICKAILIAALIGISSQADWKYWGVIWILCFYVFKDSKAKQAASFTITWFTYFLYALNNNITSHGISGMMENTKYIIYTFGSLFALVLVLFLYNGKKGKYRFSKWFFYIYYPLHLIVIYAVLQLR